ncbi:MAG TPA: DUF924 family protein [Polyangiaceae bacterium]|nr:DUF924 family protein [Polyangiaceae bacterium]
MTSAEEILSFWFGTSVHDEQAMGERARFWFRSDPDVDRDIRERFGAVLLQARNGELASWTESPRDRLALIILLDQFSRHIHRGTADAFAQDAAAQKLASEGLDLGMDAKFGPFERMFFAIPLGHSEDLAHQDRAIQYCEAWTSLLPAFAKGFAEVALGQVRRHRDVIARFGRFPTRTDALRRTSTPEEKAYLEQIKASGQPI